MQDIGRKVVKIEQLLYALCYEQGTSIIVRLKHDGYAIRVALLPGNL